ncbi:hypothetical protein ADIS_1372 [Lunatimonas lonarensis]|uniref:Uncharacterized protein n=1 Tax=Lunatimonas lonarensis TaxID=1232681 RepID=R7ZVL1_9BACT|nr:hypothetical protein ADIS_1372 [Lunatimonas lonarensis]
MPPIQPDHQRIFYEHVSMEAIANDINGMAKAKEVGNRRV